MKFVCEKFGCSMIGELGGSVIGEMTSVGVGERDVLYTCSGIVYGEYVILWTDEINT